MSTIILVTTFTAANTAWQVVAIYTAVPVPLAVVTLLGSGTGLECGNFYPKVKESLADICFGNCLP